MCKGSLEAGGSMPKKRDNQQGIVDESLRPNLIKIAAIIFIGPRGLLELEHPVFNSNLFFIPVNLKVEALHIAEALEVDWCEFDIEDLYDLFLGKPDKLEREVCNIRENLPNFVFLTRLSPGL